MEIIDARGTAVGLVEASEKVKVVVAVGGGAAVTPVPLLAPVAADVAEDAAPVAAVVPEDAGGA